MGLSLGSIAALINPVAAIGTAGMLGLDYYNAKKQREADVDARDASTQLVREQMAFQERMSSSAHVREVADLKAAGLNPVLSANSGASTPAGASTHVDSVQPTMGRFASSARDSLRFMTELAEAKSRIKLQNSQADKNKSETNLNFASEPFVRTKSDMAEFMNRMFRNIGRLGSTASSASSAFRENREMRRRQRYVSEQREKRGIFKFKPNSVIQHAR